MSALSLLFLLLVMVTVASPTRPSFTSNLVSTMSRDKADKCLAYSPVSIQLTLALMYLGAQNETANQLKSALLLSGNKEDVAKKYGKMFTAMNRASAFSISTTFFINSQLEVSEAFEKLAYTFQAELETLVNTAATANRRRINGWIEQQTAYKIQKFIPDDTKNWVVDTNLITECYFKAKWRTPFPKSRTYLESNGHMGQKFLMMVQDNVMPFAVLKPFNTNTALLKFRGTTISMLVMLPGQQKGDLAELEEKLRNMDLLEVPNRLRDSKVTLKLPKFKVETDITLKPVLRKLDLGNIFYNGNFSDILTSNSTIAFTEIRHKAIVEVNEEGIEIASVTGVEVYNPGDSHGDNFNHNFFFALIDKNYVYFAGHVVNAYSKK